MTFMKIILISQFFDTDDIEDKGAENLTNMSIDELNAIAFM